jgi:hypothetical protein
MKRMKKDRLPAPSLVEGSFRKSHEVPCDYPESILNSSSCKKGKSGLNAKNAKFKTKSWGKSSFCKSGVFHHRGHRE